MSSLNLKVPKTFVNNISVSVVIFTDLRCEMLGFSYVSLDVSVVVSKSQTFNSRNHLAVSDRSSQKRQPEVVDGCICISTAC